MVEWLLDIGEVQWVKRSIKKHNESAKSKGVKLVHCCGYDSIPSDLGTLMMVDYIEKQLKKKTSKVYASHDLMRVPSFTHPSIRPPSR